MASTSAGEIEQKSFKYYFGLNDHNAAKGYDDWKFKTMNLIRMKGWIWAVTRSAAIPTQDEYDDPAATDETKKRFTDNMSAYTLLSSSCDGVPLGLVKRARDDAKLAFEYLDEKYAIVNVSHVPQLLADFSACKLESNDKDPSKWFLELDTINDKLTQINSNYARKDYEVKGHILSNLPDGYKDLQTHLQSSSGATMSVREVETQILLKYQRELAKLAKSSKTSGNVAMTAEQRKKGGRGSGNNNKFKGRCRKCGKQGHKKGDCKSDKEGVCFECGESGHFARNCPMKSDDKPNTKDDDKKPSSGTGMYIGAIEWSFKKALPLSKDGKNKFLPDSGASTHVKPSYDGHLQFTFNATVRKESVRVGNGTEQDPFADTDLQDPTSAKQQQRHLERKYDVGGDEGGAGAGWTQVGAAAAGKYVPPSARAAMASGVKPAARTDDLNTIRVTNISENTTESDLQDLFKPFGRISRVYHAKDKETLQSRGFAFVSFVNKDDAAQAMEKLQGFGYDHLILKLEWARPNAPKDPATSGNEYRWGYGKALAQDTKEKVSFASNLTK